MVGFPWPDGACAAPRSNNVATALRPHGNYEYERLTFLLLCDNHRRLYVEHTHDGAESPGLTSTRYVRDVVRPQARELNKFWQDGGKGLPPEQAARSNLARKPAAGVGDGGASWRLKALKRARETAQREGKQLSDVVGDRWGSLSDLTTDAMKTCAAPSAYSPLIPLGPYPYPAYVRLRFKCKACQLDTWTYGPAGLTWV